jgi:hypothetical protein
MHRPLRTLAILFALLSASAMVYGATNVAAGIPITPITNTILGDPAWVTDGTFGGVWYSYQSAYYNTCSFIVDLGAQYTVNSVEIGQSQVFGYELYSSDNGTDWTLRSKVDYGGSVYNQISIPVGGAYKARYFKYWAYANWIQYVGVSEFQVIADAAPTTPARTVPALSTWAMAGLALLLLGSGLWMLRHRTV